MKQCGLYGPQCKKTFISKEFTSTEIVMVHQNIARMMAMIQRLPEGNKGVKRRLRAVKMLKNCTKKMASIIARVHKTGDE